MSVHKPSYQQPMSNPTTSPSSSTWSRFHGPCTTSALREMHTVAGNGMSPPPVYPKKDGSPPPPRMTRSAMASNSFMVTPDEAASSAAPSARLKRAPPSRKSEISCAVFTSAIPIFRRFYAQRFAHRQSPPTHPHALRARHSVPSPQSSVLFYRDAIQVDCVWPPHDRHRVPKVVCHPHRIRLPSSAD